MESSGTQRARSFTWALSVAGVISSLFGLVYALRTPPMWTPFWLHQAEGAVFAATIVALPRLPSRWAYPVITAALVVSTALIAPAAYLGGQNGLPLLGVLPLIVAVVFPESPWPTIGSGLACFLACAVLIGVFGVRVDAGYELGTIVVVATGATYSLQRMRKLRRILQQQGEEDMTRVTQALSGAAARLYSARSEAEAIDGAVEALRSEGIDAQLARRTQAGWERPQLEPLSAVLASGRAAFHHRLDALGAHLWPDAPRTTPALEAAVLVDGVPFGCLCVLSAELRPASAPVIELFAGHLGAAVENVRNHQRAQLRLEEVTRLQSALVAQERLAALGEAAAVVAHEVRNPLGAIVNAVCLLRKDADPQLTERLLTMIEQEAMSLDGLVNDLLVLARPLTPRVQPMNVAELVQRSAALVATDSQPPGRIDVLAGPADGSVTLGDPEHLQLALLNVLKNAVQASPPNVAVRVSVRTEPGRQLISIEDEGLGIPPELRARIFEPFFTTRSAGTGLGLAIAKRVVDAHLGTIHAYPREGPGTRFEIALPTTAQPVQR